MSRWSTKEQRKAAWEAALSGGFTDRKNAIEYVIAEASGHIREAFDLLSELRTRGFLTGAEAERLPSAQNALREALAHLIFQVSAEDAK